ncbi:MAG TPA: polyhydroxyalkanoate synthesis repressor PhaR [Rhodospirillaceae bacterium]|nr:polyhydroxyalkanoate synthesis repressor PhaR [Rhodospirillaceae bacterium]HAA93021.1 polyhydroxyalkanoate synthesis repressor PhaR [Rhodospirillaceae bacterium]HAT35966.1 polyhydroxyalkanoate synthesis repressor PhaR [Rhodospirillaceae bacterium]
MAPKSNGDGPITIKKYANRRLYNTATSSYVTLDHLCQMVKDGIDFTVHDAKSGEDITRSVLTQIIVEEESKGENLLPIGFLRQIIGFYGDNMQRMLVPQYLEHSMKTFAENQDQLQAYFQETMGKMFPFGSLDEVGKQNIAMFEQAMQMFSPTSTDDRPSESTANMGSDTPKSADASESQVDELQKRLDEMQRQIDNMSK